MGKFKNLASIKTADSQSFGYTPPDAAFGALLTLIKIDVKTVRLAIFGAVLRGLRRANPLGRLVIIDRFASREEFVASGIIDFMDDEMRATTITNLIMQNYRNLSPQPQRYATLTAPSYLGEYECVISVGGLTEKGASLANLTNVFVEGRMKADDESERIEIEQVDELADVYFSVGHFVHGAVVDLGESHDKVIWGDDLLAVDETAYRMADKSIPAYLDTIRKLKQQTSE
ncbi:MAG: hypothetical protein Q9P01_01560 [Anaerolineae bacterium]|nr:hypothetical protein [Anaerolineae bacterium]MDQ7033548.1 hypothetical protein [Anaerolineae bacterium]